MEYFEYNVENKYHGDGYFVSLVLCTVSLSGQPNNISLFSQAQIVQPTKHNMLAYTQPGLNEPGSYMRAMIGTYMQPIGPGRLRAPEYETFGMCT